METRYGMVEGLGDVTYEEEPTPFLDQPARYAGWQPRRYGEETAREIDEEVHRFLREAYERAESIIRSKGQAVEDLAQALLTYETVNGEEIQRLLKGERVEDLRPPAPPEAAASSGHTATESVERESAQGPERPGEFPGTPGLSPA